MHHHIANLYLYLFYNVYYLFRPYECDQLVKIMVQNSLIQNKFKVRLEIIEHKVSVESTNGILKEISHVFTE